MNEQSKEESELVSIENVDDFARLITAWHTNRVDRLEHLLEVPEGIEFQVGDGPEQKLEGDLYQGYRLGLNMALSEFGKLPFTVFAEAENDVSEANPS